MIHKPGSQPEATALWFDPKNVTLNKDVNTLRTERGKRKRWRERRGGSGGILRLSTYCVCQKIQAHIKTDRKEARWLERVRKTAEALSYSTGSCSTRDPAGVTWLAGARPRLVR